VDTYKQYIVPTQANKPFYQKLLRKEIAIPVLCALSGAVLSYLHAVFVLGVF
jgi:hypothetical protein